MIKGSDVNRLQSFVDKQIENRKQTTDEYREAVAHDAGALICSDIFPEQLENPGENDE